MAAIDYDSPRIGCNRSRAGIFEAERDLDWYHRAAESEIGLSAQIYDGGSGGVFDEAASARLHERMSSWRRLGAVKRMRRIALALVRMDAGLRALAGALYTERRWPDGALVLCSLLVVDGAGAAQANVTLSGLLPYSATAQGAFAKAHGGSEPSGPMALINWAASAVRPQVTGGRSQTRPPSWLGPARTDCLRLRMRILEDYLGFSSDLDEYRTALS